MRKKNDKQIATLNWCLHGVGLVILIACVGTFVKFVVSPLAANRQVAQQRITQLEALLARAPKVQREHQALKASLAELRESVAETQQRLPSEMREHEFLDQVRSAAQSTGIQLGEYQLGTVEELASYSKAELTFACEGSFASICKFLDQIDHLARITEIRNLQIQSTDNFNRYPVQVTFVLYFGGATHDRNMRGDVL